MPAEQQILTLFVDYFAEPHVDNIEERAGPGFTNKLAIAIQSCGTRPRKNLLAGYYWSKELGS